MKNIVLAVFFCFLFFVSCSTSDNKENLSQEDKEVENGYAPSKSAELMDVRSYVQWVQNEENGFKKEKVIDDFTFAVQFKPFEYIVCLEEKKDELHDTAVKKKILELNAMQYYDLKISLTEGEGELLKHKLNSAQQYNDRVNYFAFGMQKDIQLVEGKDTISCELYHFERSFDASPASVILLGFPISDKNISDEKTLLVYDRTFNTGLVKFTFNKKDLKNLPKLKTL